MIATGRGYDMATTGKGQGKGKPTYAGKIGNGGTQVVEALYKQPDTKGTKIKTGTDLRTGK